MECSCIIGGIIKGYKCYEKHCPALKYRNSHGILDSNSTPEYMYKRIENKTLKIFLHPYL